jgi:hypothetical protein
MNDLSKAAADLAAAMKCTPVRRARVDWAVVVLTALAALATLALVLSL